MNVWKPWQTLCQVRQCLVAWRTSKTRRKRGCHVAAPHTIHIWTASQANGAWTSHAQASRTTPSGEWHQWSCTRLATIAPAADHDRTWPRPTVYEHEAGFPGEIFHEGSANWKTTWTFVLHRPQARTQSYFQQAETRTAAVFIQIRRTRGKRGCHVAAPYTLGGLGKPAGQWQVDRRPVTVYCWSE